MKKAVKITKTVVAILIAAMAIMTVAALILGNKVGDMILNSVNSKMPVKIEAESFQRIMV